MGTTPLKLEGTNGDLKEMTTTEENYLAYHAGLHLSVLDSNDVSTITTSSSGNTLIGTYTDTTFDDPIGTHGFAGGSVPVVQTTTSLYQREGVTDWAGDSAAYRYPLEFVDSSGTYEIHEFDSSEHDTITDRIVGRIFASEYPGVYRLASSSPGGDYSVYKSGVFQDRLQTGVDGTVYNLYVRTSMTPPTAVRPMSIKRSGGATGTYEGLQEMTDAEIRYAFGARAQSRIMNGTGGVGTYQLRSSAQGAPTDTGTWSAKGSATDSRYNVGDVDYSATYTRTRQSNFEGNYSRDFTGNYTRTSIGTFEGNYSRDFLGNYSRDFVGNYTGNFTRDFEGNFVGNYSRNFVGNYTGNYSRNYSADYTRTRITDYTGDFTGDFTGNYSRAYSAAYARTRITDYTGDFTGDFTGNYSRAYTRNSTRNSTRTSTRTRVTNYVGDFVGNYLRIIGYQGNFAGDFVGNYGVYAYQRTSTRSSGRVSLVSAEGSNANFTTTFEGNFAGNFTGDFTGDFTGNYSRAFTRNSTRNSTNVFTGDFVGNYTGNYSRAFTRNSTRNSTTVFTGNFVGNFIGNYSRNFSADYSRTRVSSYSATYSRTRVSQYTSDFTRTRTSAYTRNSTVAYTRSRESNFTSDFTRTRTSTYTRNSTQDYVGNYLGNYIGTTITASTSTIETYTLYVRTA